MEEEIEFEVPTLPNFIRGTNFTEDELKIIGKEWTAELIKKAIKGKQFNN